MLYIKDLMQHFHCFIINIYLFFIVLVLYITHIFGMHVHMYDANPATVSQFAAQAGLSLSLACHWSQITVMSKISSPLMSICML
jgi:hypothetical protein